MRGRFPALAIAAALAIGGAFADDDTLWLHVRVTEGGDDGEHVRVNVPLSLVEEVLPLIDAEGLSGGRVKIDEADLEDTDFRAIWQAVRDSRDAEFVTVKGPDENVRVAKENGLIVVSVRPGGGESESVDVRVPLDVVDALFSAGPGEIDVLAAVRALGRHTDGDLVTVTGPNETVRVWIDDVQAGR